MKNNLAVWVLDAPQASLILAAMSQWSDGNDEKKAACLQLVRDVRSQERLAMVDAGGKVKHTEG